QFRQGSGKLRLLSLSDRFGPARRQCRVATKEGPTMRRYLAFHPWLPLAAALLCVSCSGRLNTVQGKVLYQGQPAKGAVVVFYPEDSQGLSAVPSTAITGEDGTFTLTSGKDGGAAAGEYVVTISWPEERPAAKDTPKISME